METSTEEHRRREETCMLYSPCNFCGEILKALLKCFGIDSTSHEHPSLDPPAETEGNSAGLSSRSVRRPPTPPISSGGGGQIN